MLGVPLVAVSCWLSIISPRSGRLQRLLLACGAGLAAGLALGLKQNLVGGLVFGGVLLAGSVLGGRLGVKDGARLAGAALVGAAVPLVWAVAGGVHPTTLWTQVFGFRSAASAVLTSGYLDEPRARAVRLLHLSVRTGMVPVMAFFLACLPGPRACRSSGPRSSACSPSTSSGPHWGEATGRPT